jgi:hypothetical protein
MVCGVGLGRLVAGIMGSNTARAWIFVFVFLCCIVLCRMYIGFCDGVRLPSQNYGLGPVLLSPGDSGVNR